MVYEIDCNDCHTCYVGQTNRHLITRIKEHKNDIKKHSDNYSVVSKHRLMQNHDFDWSNPKILHKEKHKKRKEIAEMIFIKNNNSINLQKDTEKLSMFMTNYLEFSREFFGLFILLRPLNL